MRTIIHHYHRFFREWSVALGVTHPIVLAPVFQAAAAPESAREQHPGRPLSPPEPLDLSPTLSRRCAFSARPPKPDPPIPEA